MGFLKEPSHLIIILLVLLVLFGGKKLPDAARGLGRSMRIFKSEIREMKNDDGDGDTTRTASGSTVSTDRAASEREVREPRPLEGRVVEREQREAAERREA
ncbi:MAG: Sec-independent protein translocase subunit TatA [Actinomycetes bacterium]